MSGVSNSTRDGARKFGMATAFGALGRGVELSSLLSCRPKSKHLTGVVCDVFDRHFMAKHRAPVDYALSDRFLKFASTKLGIDDETELLSSIRYLTRSAVDQYLTDADAERSLTDSAALCECRVSPAMLALGVVQGNSLRDCFTAALYELPCDDRPGARSIAYGDSFIHVRDVADMDRGDVLLGPLIEVPVDDGALHAAIDFNSHAVFGEELVLLGPMVNIVSDIEGETYMSYLHPDTPASKTSVQHFRMCNISDYTQVGHFQYPLPPIIGKLFKVVNKGGNVLFNLPRAQDISRLVAAKPELKEMVLYLLYGVLNGVSIRVDTPAIFEAEARRMRVEERTVFNGDYYRITSFSEANHGDARWDEAYSRAFA